MDLEQLNPQQKAAVKVGSGPTLVLAGAGSGKTRVLTLRIAYLIKHQNIPPRSILAMTFTNKAAGEIKKRVENLIGFNPGALWMGTFHSVCLRMLRIYGDQIGLDRNFVIYDEKDSLGVIKKILKNDQSINLTPREIRKYISRKKRLGIFPDQLEDSEPEWGYQGKIIPIYRKYQQNLQLSNALDFDDLLVYTVEQLLAEETVRSMLDRRFQYILIDEYQDINDIQYKFIKKLSQDKNNLFVVGDEDQTIYGFRGSNVYHIFKMEEDFPQVKIIKLEQNYRSTGNILKLASMLISNNHLRKEKILWTDRDWGEPVRLISSEKERDEAYRIASEILELKNQGYNLENMAILYRTNAQSRPFEEVFLKIGIPYVIVGGLKFFERKEIKDILAYLKLMVNPQDSESLARIINFPPRGISSATLQKILSSAAFHNLAPFQYLSELTLAEFTSRQINSIEQFVQLIKNLREKSQNYTPLSLLEEILEKSGYLSYWKNRKKMNDYSAQDRLENIEEFKRSVEEYQQQNPNHLLLDYLQNISLLSDIDTWDQQQSKINLMTIHSAKGLEFDVVFISGVENEIIPHIRSMGSDADLEEERRLFYVAITRAKSKLLLSYSQYRGNRLTGPSEFLSELPESCITTDQFQQPEPVTQQDPLIGKWFKHKVWGKVQVVDVDKDIALLKLADGTHKYVKIEIAPLETI